MEYIVYTDKICKGNSTYTCIELHTYVSNEHQNKYVKQFLSSYKILQLYIHV